LEGARRCLPVLTAAPPAACRTPPAAAACGTRYRRAFAPGVLQDTTICLWCHGTTCLAAAGLPLHFLGACAGCLPRRPGYLLLAAATDPHWAGLRDAAPGCSGTSASLHYLPGLHASAWAYTSTPAIPAMHHNSYHPLAPCPLLVYFSHTGWMQTCRSADITLFDFH